MTGAAASFAIVLALSAALAGLLAQRTNDTVSRCVTLAAALYALLALAYLASGLIGITALRIAVLFVTATAPPSCALAVYLKLARTITPVAAIAALAASVIAALLAMIFAWLSLAFLPLTAAVIALTAMGLTHWRSNKREAALILAATAALTASASVLVESNSPAFLLFAAAALLGIALAVSPASRVRVEQQRDGWARRTLAIRRKR